MFLRRQKFVWPIKLSLRLTMWRTECLWQPDHSEAQQQLREKKCFSDKLIEGIMNYLTDRELQKF